MIRSLVRENFKLIDKNEEVSSIFGYLYEDRFFPIVTDGKKPWGIVDIRKLLKRKLSTNEKLGDFVVGLPKIDASYSIKKAKQVMLKSGQPYLLVTYEGELIGYITALDIAMNLGHKRAGDIMKEVSPIKEDDKVSTAISELRKQNVTVIPVVDEKKLVGVVRARDLIKIETTHDKKTDYHPEKTSPLDMQVKGLMERGIRIVEPDAKEELVKIIDKQGFAIVCEGNEYKGLIELFDLLR
jgi:CBS domain-containing protein